LAKDNNDIGIIGEEREDKKMSIVEKNAIFEQNISSINKLPKAFLMRKNISINNIKLYSRVKTL
jgi:hypothetical protein